MKHTKDKEWKYKKITCLSCLKSFSKREVIGKLCIEEVRVDLEHSCSCSWKQCKKFHESFSENNYLIVYSHCIIKIMCQALVLGWLDCLFTMCSTKTETLAVAREFTFFTGKSNGSETFCKLLLYKFLNFSVFLEFLELQKYTKLPDYYRLSCFWQILFSMCWSLILMNLWVVSGVMNHGEVGIQ